MKESTMNTLSAREKLYTSNLVIYFIRKMTLKMMPSGYL